MVTATEKVDDLSRELAELSGYLRGVMPSLATREHVSSAIGECRQGIASDIEAAIRAHAEGCQGGGSIAPTVARGLSRRQRNMIGGIVAAVGAIAAAVAAAVNQ